MKKTRVLIIDDDVSLLDTMSVNLENEGFETITAINGKQGIAKAAAEKPALIIIDVNLPDIDGFSVCKEIKRLPQAASVPVIIITGDMTVDIERGFSLGADDCIYKPVDMHFLTERIHKLIHHKTKIIIVDDDRQVNDMLSQIVTRMGYEPHVYFDGSRIMDSIEEVKPDLLLFDISLPVAPDGIEMCRLVKSSDETRHIPVIMLTANEYADMVEKCFELGAEDFVFKPFNMNDLMLRIKKYLAYAKRN